MGILEAWAVGVPSIMSEACHLPEGYAKGAALPIGTSVAEIAEGIGQAMRVDPRARADMARMQQQRHILPGWFAESPVQLALAAGIEMHAVPGEAHNLKITTAEDWRLAQQLAHLLG